MKSFSTSAIVLSHAAKSRALSLDGAVLEMILALCSSRSQDKSGMEHSGGAHLTCIVGALQAQPRAGIPNARAMVNVGSGKPATKDTSRIKAKFRFEMIGRMMGVSEREDLVHPAQQRLLQAHEAVKHLFALSARLLSVRDGVLQSVCDGSGRLWVGSVGVLDGMRKVEM